MKNKLIEMMKLRQKIYQRKKKEFRAKKLSTMKQVLTLSKVKTTFTNFKQKAG